MWSSIVLSFTSPGLQRPLHHLGTAWIAKHGSFLVVPCELLLSGSTKLLDQVDERFPLDRRQAVDRTLHRPLVKSKDFPDPRDRKSTRLNSSHTVISYAVFCLKKKKKLIVERVHLQSYRNQCYVTYTAYYYYAIINVI